MTPLGDRLPPLPAGPHPTPDEIYRARTEPSWPRGKTILAHTAACAPCTEDMLRQEAFDEPEAEDGADVEAAWAAWEQRLQAGEAEPSPASSEEYDNRPASLAPVTPLRRPGQDRRAVPKRSPFRALFLLAATFAACFVGLSVWRMRTAGVSTPAPETGPAPVATAPGPPAPLLPPTTGPEPTRGGIPGGLAEGPSGEPSTWSPEGELPEAPSEFLFSQETPGPRRVTVYDAARSYFWTSPPSSTGRIPFPDSERKKLTPGVDYFWTLLGSEGVPSEGAALRFRLEPPAAPR